MNQYLITAWTHTSILVGDSDMELVGADVVIGTYEGETEEIAKEKASWQNKIPFEQLEAYQIQINPSGTSGANDKKNYLVDVAWTIGKQVVIQASSVEEAKGKALQLSIDDGEYVEDSFTVDSVELLDEED